jgi:uncharacterized protein with HEPN domain
MKREIADYVMDVLDAIAKCKEFIEGMEYKDFVSDDKTVFAVVRTLEVIGEAVKNIPDEVRKEHIEVPWKEMAGMRDKLIHGYFGVDLKRVWQTAKEEIPALKPFFEKIMRDLK